MAVYTQVPAEMLADFIARYDIGHLVSAKGIAEGVENSNYLVDTSKGRFILTLYEKRTKVEDLPYFLNLMTHLADRGVPVPRPIADRAGQVLQHLAGRPACLIEFLSGISVTEPTPNLCAAAGGALARMHLAAADYAGVRANGLTLDDWVALADDCDEHLGEIDASLPALVAGELAGLQANWPHELPRGTIHADLFPDNVLAMDEQVSGVIDFYFACTDISAYDLAITHAAWCFSSDGATFYPARAAAMVRAYETIRPLSAAESAAFQTLCRGAAMRFLLTRAYDWINTPADAMVTRKDPMAFARRLRFYQAATTADLLGR